MRKPQVQVLDFEPRTLGKHILHARLTKKLLQKDAARQIGVRVQALGSWENDRRHPLISQMPAILTFLGYDPKLPEEITLTLQDRMREKRRVMGWSVEDAADHYGVADYIWRRWETGRNKHSPVEDIERFLREQNPKEFTPPVHF
jgi:transcriptional regulator with XRE-family HTH domain